MPEFTPPQPMPRDNWFDQLTVLVHPALRGRATAVLEQHGIRLVPVSGETDVFVLTDRG